MGEAGRRGGGHGGLSLTEDSSPRKSQPIPNLPQELGHPAQFPSSGQGSGQFSPLNEHGIPGGFVAHRLPDPSTELLPQWALGGAVPENVPLTARGWRQGCWPRNPTLRTAEMSASTLCT